MLQLVEPFWRTEPFTASEHQLLGALFAAHYQSAFRNNPSTVTVVNAASGSHDFTKAVGAACLSMGGRHAPLIQTIEFLDQPYPALEVPFLIAKGTKIPGWGGTFQKEKSDPIWSELDGLLRKLQPETAIKLDSVTLELASIGKFLYPNPSAYTALVAITLGMPKTIAPYLFIAGRLSAWAQIAIDHLPGETVGNIGLVPVKVGGT